MPTLEITTMVGCPLMCTFCPQSNLRENYGKSDKYMTLENFQRMLSSVPTHVRIDFSGMAEPWANPAATDMLEHALQRGYTVAIFTTLYGMEDPDRVIGLLAAHRARVHTVCLHLPDDDGNMRGWKKTDAYMNALHKFIDAGLTKKIIPFEAMTMQGNMMVHKDISFIRLQGQWASNNRAGALDNDQNAEGPRHEAAVSCRSTPFYDHNVLLPNGDVLLCCMDYNKKHTLGNLLTMSYSDVFTSKSKWDVLCSNSKIGFTEDSICKSCFNVNKYDVVNSCWKPAEPIVLHQAELR